MSKKETEEALKQYKKGKYITLDQLRKDLLERDIAEWKKNHFRYDKNCPNCTPEVCPRCGGLFHIKKHTRIKVTEKRCAWCNFYKEEFLK